MQTFYIHCWKQRNMRLFFCYQLQHNLTFVLICFIQLEFQKLSKTCLDVSRAATNNFFYVDFSCNILFAFSIKMQKRYTYKNAYLRCFLVASTLKSDLRIN